MDSLVPLPTPPELPPVIAIAVVMAIPSNIRLNYAEHMKKKGFALTVANADSHMVAIS